MQGCAWDNPSGGSTVKAMAELIQDTESLLFHPLTW